MRSLRNKLVSALATVSVFSLLFLGECFAGTFANLNFIGFSKDGQYLAFESYGVGDGSGYGYSWITFVDTEKNTWVADPVSTKIEDETGKVQEARDANKKKVSDQISKLGIVEGNTGKHVISHPLADMTRYTGPIRFTKASGSMYRDGEYELSIKEFAAESEDCTVFVPPKRKIFELVLTNKKTKQKKMLQRDSAIPKSRGCPESYKISDVYIYEDKIAVFLNMFSPGYEGPDMRYLVVTGTLE